MCELSTHNNKVIFLDTDKVYDKKVGSMLKTNDNKYISRKVIKNKKNKLYWRHIFSYLNEDCLQIINQMIYRHKMKTEVLKIDYNVISSYDYPLNAWVYELYNISRYNRQGIQEIFKKEEEEDWEIIDIEPAKKCLRGFWEKNHIKNNERILKENKSSKKLDKFIKKNSSITFYMDTDKKICKNNTSIRRMCCGLKNNGDLCGNTADYKIDYINKNYYNRWITHNDIHPKTGVGIHLDGIYLKFCGIHYKKYDKLYIHKYQDELDKIYNKLGYKLHNNYLCKMC